MLCLNLAGQGLATARAASMTKAVLKGANSMKQVREALAAADASLPADAAETHSVRYAAAMREPIAELEVA